MMMRGATTPLPSVHRELEAFFELDQSCIADVYRRTKAGQTVVRIQKARGAKYPNFVGKHRRLLDALFTGNLPTSPSMAGDCANLHRRVLKLATLSPTAVETLELNLQALERLRDDLAARQAEAKAARRATEQAEDEGVAGVYVYSFPHAVTYLYAPELGLTVFKVGQSEREAPIRVDEQMRVTSYFEDPVLLRIYPTEKGAARRMEKAFHDLIIAAGHRRTENKYGGREWFITDLDLLDAIAAELGLDIRRVDEEVETDGSNEAAA